MMPIWDSDLGFSLFVTVQNIGQGPISIVTRPVQCCEVLTSSVTDCKTIKLMGGYMGTILPGRYHNASWVYPTLYEYNRRGECILELWWRDSFNRTDSKRFTIPFDTYYLYDDEPSLTMSRKKANLLMTKRCDSPDLDILDNCLPVDCHMKYDGNKNYFSWSELLCVPSPTCYADPEKQVPDVGYSPNCNLCSNLDSPIGEDDMAFLLRPSVNMDIYETMPTKKEPPLYHTMRCHHGVMDPETEWCVCEPGWTSAPVPEDFSIQRTIFTHMCTIFNEETSYDFLFIFSYISKELWTKERLFLLETSLASALIVVFVSCFLRCCCLQCCCLKLCCLQECKKEKEEDSYRDICENDDDDSEVLLDSDATEICSLSSENPSDDVSDFHFTESSSGHSSDSNSRRVTWESNKSSWQLNPSQKVEVLYPAKSCIKRQSSTGVDSKSSSKESASSSTDRQKMFEMHFRLLVSLLLRKQPSTDAREHLDWIFKNCPGYQRRIVMRFMKSFGMDVDKNGNIRGFRRQGSKVWKKNKTRSCHLRPKRLNRAYRRRQGKRWEESTLSHCEGCREEPEGSSDIDRSLTISPDYGDILKSVLPMCMDASPITEPEREPQEESDPEEEEQYQLPECSSSSLTPSQLDVSTEEITPLMKKASVIQFLALGHKKPSINSGLPTFVNYLKNIEDKRISYSKFIEEIPTPVSSSSSCGSDLCIRKTPMDLIHHWLTERVMQRLASLEERYRGILSNKHHWEHSEVVRQDTSGIVQKRSSEHIDEEETFIKFFKNLVHFLFLLSCKREMMMKIMTTFGCTKHRTEMRFHPLVCLFLCYLQPILFKFWKIVELEKLLLEFFVLEYPQQACLGFLTRLKKTTKFRICLYLHMYRILGMITRMEGVKEPLRVKFLLHINELERDLVRFFKDMEKFKGLKGGVKSSYNLAGGLLSILEVLHYFMVQSLYKMCLMHVEKADS